MSKIRNSVCINNRFSISWRGLFTVLAGILFFPPEGAIYLGFGQILTLYNYVTYLAVLMFFLYVIIKMLRLVNQGQKQHLQINLKKDFFVSTPFLQFFLTFLITCTMLIPTVLYDGAIKMLLDRMFIVFGAFILVRYAAEHNDRKKLVERMFWLFLLITLINFIFILFFYSRGSLRSTGGGDYWLFGQKNAIRNIVLPAVGFAAVRDELNHRKFFSVSTLFTMGIALLTLILVKSGTSIVVALFLTGMLILEKYRNKDMLSFRVIVVGYAILNILLVNLRNIDVFRYFIEDVMNKDMSLSGRTYIWDSAVAGIEKRPLLGRGIQTFSESELHVGGFFVSHAHNAILDILYKGGLISTVLLILLIAVSCKDIWNRKALKRKHNMVLSYWTILISAFLIAGIVGELWSFGFFVVLFCTEYFYKANCSITFVEDIL